jgi:ketosteroid isomerase-like protein
MPRASQIHGSPEDIESAYYDALSRADVNALMSLWADDDEIVCIHPSAPRLVGHAAIRASWEEIFSRGGLHIQPRHLQKMHNVMSAVHNVIENVRREGRAAVDVHVLATNVYLKTAQGWRIVMHHASVAAGGAPAEHIAASVLH